MQNYYKADENDFLIILLKKELHKVDETTFQEMNYLGDNISTLAEEEIVREITQQEQKNTENCSTISQIFQNILGEINLQKQTKEKCHLDIKNMYTKIKHQVHLFIDNNQEILINKKHLHGVLNLKINRLDNEIKTIENDWFAFETKNVLDNVEKNFNKLQKVEEIFPGDNEKDIYSLWAKEQIVPIKKLKIQLPDIPEIKKVQIECKIKDNDFSTGQVTVEININYHNTQRSFIVEISGYLTKEKKIKKDLNALLNHFDDRVETWHGSTDLFCFNEKQKLDAEQLGITEPDEYDKERYVIEFEIVAINAEEGHLIVLVKAISNEEKMQISKVISVVNWEPGRWKLRDVGDYFRKWTAQNRFDLKEQITIDDTWNDALEKMRSDMEREGLNCISKDLKFEAAYPGGKPLSTSLRYDGVKTSQDFKDVKVKYNDDKEIGNFYIHFKNIRLKPQKPIIISISQTEKFDNAFELTVGPTWDWNTSYKVVPLIAHFEKTYGNWSKFVEDYKKITLNNFKITIHSAMQERKINQEILTPTEWENNEFYLNEETLGKELIIHQRHYNDYTSEQKTKIWVELHINQEDLLEAHFKMSGLSRSAENRIYMWLEMNEIKIT